MAPKRSQIAPENQSTYLPADDSIRRHVDSGRYAAVVLLRSFRVLT